MLTRATTDSVSLYMDSIGRTPLMTREEEISAGEQLATARAAVVAALSGSPEARAEIALLVDRFREQRLRLADIADVDTDAQDYEEESATIDFLARADAFAVAKKPDVSALGLKRSTIHDIIVRLRARPYSKRHRTTLDVIATAERKVTAARERFIKGNLRLVVSFANKRTGHGLSLLDLIQEGNIGLMRATETFDYTRGFKFSTYAGHWIRQSIDRGIHDKGTTIRIPVHLKEKIAVVRRAERDYEAVGHTPTPEELAKTTDLPIYAVRTVLAIQRGMPSLNQPYGEEGDSELGDVIASETPSAEEAAIDSEVRIRVGALVSTLNHREREVVRMRFGFDGKDGMTLEEVGKRFSVTRERIRQIEAKALKRLQHSTRASEVRELAAAARVERAR